MAAERTANDEQVHRARWNCPRRRRGRLSLAFGVALLFAGLVTTASVSILGAILAVCGWCGLVSRRAAARET